MATLAQLRQLFPDAGSDEATISRAAKEFRIDPMDIATEVGYNPGSGSLTKERLGGSIDSYQSNMYGLGGAVARGLGAPGVAKWMDEGRDDNKFEADVHASRGRALGGVDDFREVDGIGSGANYVGGLLAQSAPYLLESLTGGIVARGLMTGTKLALRGAETVEAANAARKTLNTGSLVGGAAASYPSAVGDILSNQRDENGTEDLGWAAAGGVPYAALNVMGAEGVLARGLRPRNLLEGGVLARVGKAAGTTAVGEGLSETGQEMVNQSFGRMAVNPDETLFNEDANKRYLDSFVGGAAMGGVLGAPAGLRRGETPAKRDLLGDQEQQQPDFIGPAPERVGPAPFDQSQFPIIADIHGVAEVGPNAGATIGEDQGTRLARQRYEAQREQNKIVQEAAAQSAQAEQAFQQLAQESGIPPKGPAMKAFRMLEDERATLTPEEYGSLLGGLQSGHVAVVKDFVSKREKAVTDAQKAHEKAAAQAQREAEKVAKAAEKETARQAKLAEGTAEEREINANTDPAALADPVEALKAKWAQQIAERKAGSPPTVKKSQTVAQAAPSTEATKAAQAAQAERFKTSHAVVKTLLDEQETLEKTNATGQHAERLAAINAEVEKQLPSVAELRDEVARLLADPGVGKKYKIRLSRVTGMELTQDPDTGENVLVQVNNPTPMAQVGEMEGVGRAAISKWMGQKMLSDAHIARLAANPIEVMSRAQSAQVALDEDTEVLVDDSAVEQEADTTVESIAGGADRDSGADAAKELVKTEGVRVESSASRAFGEGLTTENTVYSDAESKYIKAAANKIRDSGYNEGVIDNLTREKSDRIKVAVLREVAKRKVNDETKAAPKAPPSASDLAFEAKREEAARKEAMAAMARWAQFGDGRHVGKWWDDRVVGDAGLFDSLSVEAQLDWALAIFNLTNEEINDARLDTIYTEQAKSPARRVAETSRSAERPEVPSGDGTSAQPSTGSGTTAPKPEVKVKKKRVPVLPGTAKVALNNDVLGPGTAEAAAINRDVNDNEPDLPINRDALGGAQMSKAKGATGSTAAQVLADIKQFMHAGILTSKLTVVQSVGDLPSGVAQSVNPDATTQGFVVGGKAYLVADNIAPGKARSVLLHEVGAHLGLENLLGKAQYARLVAKVNAWAAKNDGSLESKIAQAAQARVESAGTSDAQRDTELVAYFIEEAVDAGVNPTADNAKTELGRWFRTVWAAFKVAARKLGMNPDKLTAQDVVNMAYGAAKLELTGAFHGTAAEYRKFNHDYMSTGEGAQAFGWGSYFAQAPGIAKGYWKTDTQHRGGVTTFDGKQYKLDDWQKLEVALVHKYPEVSRMDYVSEGVAEGMTLADLRKGVSDFTSAKDRAQLTMVLSDLTQTSTAEGNLMRVDFNVAEDEWLDLDNTLSPGNLARIQKHMAPDLIAALEEEVNLDLDEMTGKDVYQGLQFLESRDGLVGEEIEVELYNAQLSDGDAKKVVSYYLDSIGIKGNKFLDANSRSWKPARVKDASYMGLSGKQRVQWNVDYVAKNGYSTLAVFPTEAEARDFAAKSDAGREQTANLVVFNDKNIQRVSSMKGADRERVQFSKAAPVKSGNKFTDAMPDAVASFFDKIKAAGSEFGVRLMFTEDLANVAARALPAAAKYMDAMKTITVAKTKHEREVAAIVHDFQKLTSHERGTGPHSVNALLKDSTMQKAWAFTPDWLPAGTVTVNPALALRYNALSKEARTAVERVFRHGHDSLQQLKAAATASVTTEFDAVIQTLTTAGKTEEAAKQVKAKQKTLGEFRTLLDARSDWPYAPLRRFGNHVVMGVSRRYLDAKVAGDIDLMKELETNGDHYYVAFAQTRQQAARMERDIQASFADGETTHFARLENEDSMLGGRDMLAALRRLRNLAEESSGADEAGKKTGENTASMIRQLYLQVLSETSARKGEIHRRNIAGASEDMMRAFASQGQSTAHFTASLKTGGVVDEHIAKMRQEVRASVRGRETPQRYYNEIMRRHALNLEFEPTPGVDKALAVSSSYLLLSNPSYFLMNATQPWMMSHPMMAAKHGYVHAANELVRAYKDIAPLVAGGAFREEDYSKLPADVRDIIARLADSGDINIALESELGKFESESDGHLRHMGKAMNWVRGAAQSVEALNRLSTAIAAIRMEKQKNSSDEAAFKYAKSIIVETHGNYTGFNAPRFMRSGVGRVATQFRKFQLIQLSMFARLLRRSFSSLTTAEEKTVARYALTYNLAHLTAIGGAAALPGFTAAAWLIGKAIPDDDTPDDPRATLTRAVGREMADLLWGGATQLASVPLGGRIGAGNMLSLLPYTDIEVSRKGYADIATGLAGPLIGGILPRAADGVQMIARGDLWKGTEALLPSGLSNAMKAGRFATEGITQKNGDRVLSPEELGWLDIAGQAVGLPTSTIQDRFFLSGSKFKAEAFYKDRTSELKRDYADAYQSNDSAAMQETRRDWMRVQAVRRELGFKMQPLSELQGGPAARREREAGAVKGVPTSKASEGFLKRLI